MSLFEVPGWSVPSAPIIQASKKRKRPEAAKGSDDIDIDDAQKIHAAQKNIERLMQSLGAGMDDLHGETAEMSKKKKRREGKEKGREETNESRSGKHQERAEEKKRSRPSREQKKAKNIETAAPSSKSDRAVASPSKDKKKRKSKEKRKHGESEDGRPEAGSIREEDVPEAPVTNPSGGAQIYAMTKKSAEKTTEKDGLTALQSTMKKSLDGARFRYINEMLYKSDSAKAHELMSQDPAVFADYHTGFRHQVESWPTNPVSHYISALSSYTAKTVIADLGCGDAALARALVPKGMVVLSFDLISDGAYVVEADTCVRVPLPGSEGQLNAHESKGSIAGEGQVVDVVVCALSLMGTNWPGCIREAWRILRPGGELKIAEVTSRIASAEGFMSFISSFGFKLKDKDERNTHFILFEFTKVARKNKSDKDWKTLLSQGDILKPCEYKRR